MKETILRIIILFAGLTVAHLLLFVDKSYIKIGTLICMFCGGPIIDLFNLLLGNLITPESHMSLLLPEKSKVPRVRHKQKNMDAKPH